VTVVNRREHTQGRTRPPGVSLSRDAAHPRDDRAGVECRGSRGLTTRFAGVTAPRDCSTIASGNPLDPVTIQPAG
jgi:hypothetical protein